MKNILTIFKKEWDRVIKDKRLVLTVMIFPGLMIFLIYTFIGNAISGMTTQDVYNIAIVNPESAFTAIYETDENADKFNVVDINSNQMQTYKDKIDNNEWTILIYLDPNIESYDGTGTKPDVSIYYNPNEIASSQISSTFMTYLSMYRQQLSFDLYGDTSYFNLEQSGTPLKEGGLGAGLMNGMLSMLIIMFLFSGAMSIGPESIAGEKERGTIATILVTPVKRHEIAIGKILALSLLTLISATSSFIGIILSLPKMLQASGSLSIGMFSVGDYLLILLVLFSTVFVIVGIISIISAYAKSVKEAGSLIIPIYILTILVAVTSMFSSQANSTLLLYVIPIYNSVQSLTAIFTADPSALLYILITVAANIVYLSLFVTLLNKMFNSEKIMFNN